MSLNMLNDMLPAPMKAIFVVLEIRLGARGEKIEHNVSDQK
jgi:hypothetical protein